MKLETVIYKAYQKLKNNNIKSAMLDSELLMAKAINESREYIILNSNKDIGEKDYNNFQTMITQRSNGKPIAYLTNKKIFWKYEFFGLQMLRIPLCIFQPRLQLFVLSKPYNDINTRDVNVIYSMRRRKKITHEFHSTRRNINQR